MNTKYSNDKATLYLVSLLKAHGIRKVIASPGTTNIAFVASVMYDSWFQVYSSVDERSAAYMACGLSSESGEPVVITCTGATASRNYLPGLTEAYYRKLPIIAVTGSHGEECVGHLHAQSLDRTQQPIDTIRKSVSLDTIISKKDEWSSIVKINSVLLELKRHGGGPVHINLKQATTAGYDVEQLPNVRKIERFFAWDSIPVVKAQNVAIFIGAHRQFSVYEIELIEKFCEKFNGAVFGDHTSGYRGKYFVNYSLVACQAGIKKTLSADLLLHIGEISGDSYTSHAVHGKETWRVSEDGEIRDFYKNLSFVFEMNELTFFKKVLEQNGSLNTSFFYETAKARYDEIQSAMPELPFGNIWVAQHLHDKLPIPCSLHFAIFNSLRSWNFFELDTRITTNCNVGGFGIDGAISTLIGASLANENELHFCVTGDLAFFYDLNSIGNRHIKSNLRILLINNGCGTEFRNYDHPASKWGEEANAYFAAGGHFGNKSKDLVRNMAEALGFVYLNASSKNDFFEKYPRFVDSSKLNQPILFEVFTSSNEESMALRLVRNIVEDERSLTEKAANRVKLAIFKLVNKIK